MEQHLLWPVAVGGMQTFSAYLHRHAASKGSILPLSHSGWFWTSWPRQEVGMETRDGARGRGQWAQVCVCMLLCILKNSHIQHFYFTFIIKGWNKWRRSYAGLVTSSSHPIKTQAWVLRPRVNVTFDGWLPHAQQSSAQLRLSKLSWMRNEGNLSHSSTALKN